MTHLGPHGLSVKTLALLTVIGFGLPAVPQARAGAKPVRCADSPAFTGILEQKWQQRGATSVRIDLPPQSGRDLLLRIAEKGIDVELEVLDRNSSVISRAASPLERAGALLAFLPAAGPTPVTAVITAKEPAKIKGFVHMWLSVARSQPLDTEPQDACPNVLTMWSEADATYAAGRSIELGRAVPNGKSAHELFESAAKSYRAALQQLPALASAADRADLGLSLAAILYYEVQDWAGSAEWASTSAATFATVGDAYKHARAQAILAAAWLEMATQSQSAARAAATPQKSRERLHRARDLLRALARFHARRHEQYEESLQINNIGLAYYYEARFELALPYFYRARDTFERLGETARLAVALQNLALCDWGLGRLSAALPEFDRALTLLGPVPFPHLYLVILSNSGLAHYAAGQFDRSLQLQAEALDFATRSQADRARARSYYGMGVTYYAIGNRALATDFLRDALDIATPQLDARIRVAALRALALIEHETGHHPDAIAHSSEALSLATASSARARILLRLAQDYASQDDVTTATKLLDGLIAHPPEGDALVRAMALVQRGSIMRTSGKLAAAEHDLTEGLTTLERYDSLAERFDTQVELARLRADQGNSARALATVRRALRLAPEIREQTANPEYRASISQSLRPALDFEMDLLRARYDGLIRDGQVAAARRVAAAALQAVDAPRAIGFDEWRAERLEGAPDLHVAHLLAQSVNLYRQMAERRFQLATRDDRAGPGDPRAKVLRADIFNMRVRLDVINAELAARTTGSSGLSSISRQEPDWLAHQSQLPKETAIVSYWIGSNHAYAWLVSQTDLVWVSLAPSAVVDRSARKLHDAMKSLMTVPASARLEDCAELYRLIIAPIAKYVDAAHSLIVIPDGSLHYVPFSALRDATRSSAPYLAQRLVISVEPAVRFEIKPRPASQPPEPRAPARVLIVADPVYTADDPRLNTLASTGGKPVMNNGHGVVFRGSSAPYSLTRLQSSAREASEIQSLYDPRQVDLLQGLTATRDELARRNLADYRFIHIASHGLIDSEIPQLSALILGTYGSHGPVKDPYFRAGDFLARTFNADAIVLSACDTALGAELSSEGLIGLRYAALARGAHAVVASLWPVSDGIAAELMTGMYREMTAARNVTTKPGERVAEAVAAALTAATRQLLQRSPEADPALWAPFTVYVAGD